MTTYFRTAMTRTSPPSEDSNEVPHEDPGAYLLPFEPFKRLDAIPTGLRWWATRDKCQKNSWVGTVYDNLAYN